MEMKSIGGHATTATMVFSRWLPGKSVHAALQREKHKIKIVSNESGAKKFLLNWF